MIILRMTNGDIIKVPGVMAVIKDITKSVTKEETVAQVVEVRDSSNYSANVTATFKLSEVKGFEVDSSDEPEDE